jgi:hypothetical protein
MPEGPKPTDLSPSTIRQGDCSSDVTTSPRTTSILEQGASLREPTGLAMAKMRSSKLVPRRDRSRCSRTSTTPCFRRPADESSCRSTSAGVVRPITYDLGDRADRARVYEQVLREGTEADVRYYVDPEQLRMGGVSRPSARGPNESLSRAFTTPCGLSWTTVPHSLLSRNEGAPVRVRASASYQRGDGSPARQRLASRSGVLDDAHEVSLGGPIERPGRPGSRPADTSRRRRDSRLGASRRAPRRDPPSL